MCRIMYMSGSCSMCVPMYVGMCVVVYVCMYVYTSNSVNVNTQTVEVNCLHN